MENRHIVSLAANKTFAKSSGGRYKNDFEFNKRDSNREQAMGDIVLINITGRDRKGLDAKFTGILAQYNVTIQ